MTAMQEKIRFLFSIALESVVECAKDLGEWFGDQADAYNERMWPDE